MDQEAKPPRRHGLKPLIERSEQTIVAILALAVVAGVLWRAAEYHRVGREPLEPIPPSDGPTYRVNVNRADWVLLTLVPGIGEKTARKIVAKRDELGGRFADLEQLREVDGIGEKVLAKLRRYLYLADPEADDEPVRMAE
jgi:competence ComEA-like helix-hairpin-helix protein